VNGYEATVQAEQWHREAAEDGVTAETLDAARYWGMVDADELNGYLP
jgi:hypothetical protein